MEELAIGSIEEAPTFVGGCRALPGGLHFGHVYGCMLGVPRTVPLYFVISDCLSEGMTSERSIMRVASETIAAGALLNLDIRPVRESVLRHHLSPLFQCLLGGVSFRLLAEAHPPKAQIKTEGFTGTVDDYLFPIHQAAYLLGLGCGIACYNDDNSRYVDLTRKVARRTNTLFGVSLNANIALLAKDPSRLRSWDGRRMAKSYNNTLSVCATSSEVQRFAERMVGRASVGEPSFDTCGQSELERLYLSAFGRQTIPSNVLGRERIALLASVLTEWCRDLEALQGRVGDVTAYLIDDERQAIQRIQRELKRAGIKQVV